MCSHGLVEGSTSGRTSAPQFEAVAVAYLLACGGIACMPSPAAVDDYGVIHHIEVPVVIAIGPCTASVKLCSRTREELACKAVGIAAIVGAIICATIVVLVGITVDDLVVTTVGIARIELWSAANGKRLGLFDGEVLVHTYLQSCVVVPTEDASLNDVIGTFYLHAVIFGILKHKAVEGPVVGFMIHVDAASHLEIRHRGVVHRRAVDDNLPNGILGPCTHLATTFCRCRQGGNLDALADGVCAFMNKDTVTSLHLLDSFVDGKQRRSLCAGIVVVTRCGHMDVCS